MPLIIREALEKIRLMDLVRDEAVVDSIQDYFGYKDDHSKVRDAIKARYGIGIKEESDPNNKDAAPFVTYSRGEFRIMVDSGLIEAITIGWGQKIISALATLFSEDGQRFVLQGDDSTDDDLADEQGYIKGIRERGGFDSALVDADRNAIQSGSGAVLITAKNSGLNYQPLSAADVRFYWPDKIMEGEISRTPDYSDVEDAYAIVIRVSQIDTTSYNYLAIFGRSQDYPNGRWAQYVASNDHDALPAPMDPDVTEYEINGEIANPLSYFGNQYPDLKTPDYPICIIAGVAKDRSRPMPVTTSLYEDDIEFTLTASHLLSKGNDAAGGLTVVSIDHEATSVPLPSTLTGATTALPGQGIEHITKNAGDVKTALEVANMLQVGAASGYSVPDYMVVSEDYTMAAESGIALQVKTRPLIKARQRREKDNRQQVQKIFDIEKALLNLHYEYPEAAALLPLNMLWYAGELQLPENKKEKTDRLLALYDKKIIDAIAVIREYYDLSSDAEAVELYKAMEERIKEYPGLGPVEDVKPPRPVGANFRRNKENA